MHEALQQCGLKRCVEIYGASEGGAWPGVKPLERHFASCRIGKAMRYLEKIRRRRTALEFDLSDIAILEGERLFRLHGRKDKAVQVAGINVYPAKAEAFYVVTQWSRQAR